MLMINPGPYRSVSPMSGWHSDWQLHTTTQDRWCHGRGHEQGGEINASFIQKTILSYLSFYKTVWQQFILRSHENLNSFNASLISFWFWLKQKILEIWKLCFHSLNVFKRKHYFFVSILVLFYYRDLLDWDFSILCTIFQRLKSIQPALLHKNQSNEVFKNMLRRIMYGIRIFVGEIFCFLYYLKYYFKHSASFV